MKLYKLLFLVPLFASCELDKEPYGLADLWATEGNAQKGLDAAYQPFYEEEGFGRGHWWAGPLSDDMVVNRDKPEIIRLATFTDRSNTSGGMADNWKYMYRVIRRSNDVLKNVPNIDMSESKKNIMLGEANFLCAYSYFFLAKRFGGLPFYDYKEPDNFNKPRETKQKTYENIEAYLKAAISYFEKENLWERTSSDWGRPNLGAAYGLLAKVYAHWGKFDLAKSAAEEVINSGIYGLDKTNDNGFDHLFSIDGEKHKEVLFNLTNKEIRNEGTITSTVLMSEKLTDGKGWYYFAPTQSLRDAFNAFGQEDKRRKTTIVGEGDVVSYIGKEFVLTTDPNFDSSKPEYAGKGSIRDMSTGYMCAKYSNAYKKLNQWQWESGADVPLLRYADVLLIHAEAIMQLAGANANNRDEGVPAAAKSFNEVHQRAGLSYIAAPTFMDLVKERRCELAYEDERHYDLVRWELAKEVYASENDPYGGRTFDPAKDRHLPLPQKEIDNSNGVLINNPAPGYSDFGPVE